MPNSQPINCVCFTGHRSIEPEKAAKIIPTLEQILRLLIGHGITQFYAGGALGFDTIAALTVLKLKKDYPHIKLGLILPCKDQTKRWSDYDREIYNSILSRADSAQYVCESYTSFCMHERNRRLVDSAQVCVAFCEHSGGGTAHTMAYALKQNIELINISDFI